MEYMNPDDQNVSFSTMTLDRYHLNNSLSLSLIPLIVYIYIYIYRYLLYYLESGSVSLSSELSKGTFEVTPNLPTKIIPTKIIPTKIR